MGNKQSGISVANVLKFGGAIVAYLAGAGFATGQEALQFFSVFGVAGALGASVMALLCYLWFCATVMKDGHSLAGRLSASTPKAGYRYYCGKLLGTFYNIYTTVFMFLVFVIMVAAAGAIAAEYYQLNEWMGRLVLVTLTLLTVLAGLNKVVDVVSKLAYGLLVFALTIGVANMVIHSEGFLEAGTFLASHETTKAADTWYISGLIFPAMGGVLLTPFLLHLGGLAASRREAQWGGLAGGSAFVLAVVIIAFGILADIEQLSAKEIPLLFISQQLFPGVAFLFSVVLIAAVFSTAVPMLWLSATAVVPDEGKATFKLLVVGLALVALVGSQLSFRTLINVLYPTSGYLGVLLFVCVFIKQIRGLLRRD
ncbi:YkvI family membrane protein [Parapedobacter sp.]